MDVMLLVKLKMDGPVWVILVKKSVGISIELELRCVMMETILIIKVVLMIVQVIYQDMFVRVVL